MLKKFVGALTAAGVVLCTCFFAYGAAMVPIQQIDQTATQRLETKIEHGFDGWRLWVNLPDTNEDEAVSILPYYSFDGQNFMYNEDDQLDWVYDSMSVPAVAQPMASFLSGDVDQFWLCAKIVGENTSQFTQVAHVFRSDTPVPLPENTNIHTVFPAPMLTGAGIFIRGSYHVTIRQTDTQSQVLQSLPTQLPIEVQLENGGKLLAKQQVDYQVNWNVPTSFPLGETTYLGAVVSPPATAIVRSPLLAYACDNLPSMSMQTPSGTVFIPMDLTITTVPVGQNATLALSKSGVDGVVLPFAPSPLAPWHWCPSTLLTAAKPGTAHKMLYPRGMR